MKARIFAIDETGSEVLQNIRYTDEIADDQNMSEAELITMENNLQSAGRFWITANLIVRRIAA